jgi:PTH1 family peptidyl-tRNA hydrolase
MITKLIVGLGNPETKYKYTRHNVGYMLVDAYIKWHQSKSCVVRYNKAIGLNYLTHPDYTTLLLKPKDNMNLSGVSAGLVCGDLHIDPENVLAIHDDLSFDFGITRLRPSGSSGGHKGVQSVIDALGPNFARFKVGIGRPEQGSVLDFVLSDFTSKERNSFCELTHLGIRVIDSFLRFGIQYTMQEFNRVG